MAQLRSRSVILEAVACDDNGMPSFDRLRHRRHDGSVFLYAFDLIELNGDDLRRDPLDTRKATLASLLSKARAGLRFNFIDQVEPAPRLCDCYKLSGSRAPSPIALACGRCSQLTAEMGPKTLGKEPVIDSMNSMSYGRAICPPQILGMRLDTGSYPGSKSEYGTDFGT